MSRIHNLVNFASYWWFERFRRNTSSVCHSSYSICISVCSMWKLTKIWHLTFTVIERQWTQWVDCTISNIHLLFSMNGFRRIIIIYMNIVQRDRSFLRLIWSKKKNCHRTYAYRIKISWIKSVDPIKYIFKLQESEHSGSICQLLTFTCTNIITVILNRPVQRIYLVIRWEAFTSDTHEITMHIICLHQSYKTSDSGRRLGLWMMSSDARNHLVHEIILNRREPSERTKWNEL